MKEDHSKKTSVLTQIYHGALQRSKMDRAQVPANKKTKLNKLQTIKFIKLKQASTNDKITKGKNLKLHTSNKIDRQASSSTSKNAHFCEGELQLHSLLQSLRVQDLEKRLHGRCRVMIFKEKVVAKKKMGQKMSPSSSLKRHVISDLSKK
jgi:hypothetical protein